MTIGSDDPTLASKVAKAPRRFQEEADRKIVHALAQVNYDLGHPLSQILAQRLLEYGVGTLLNMARDDRLFRRCESLVRSTLPAPPPTWRAEAPTVVTMAVHAAIPRFIGRGLAIWDPDKASLLTFFVNYCLLTFKDHYLTFCRQEARQARESPVFNVAEWAEDRAAPDDVEATALARVTLGEITATIGDSNFTEFARLSMAGHTHAQIAEELGMSARTLKRRVSDWRTLVEKSRSESD